MHARSRYARVLLAAALAAQLPTIARGQNGQIFSGISDTWCLTPIVLADLNLDGRLDQVGQHMVTGQPVAFRLGLPDGTYAPPVEAGVTCLEPLVGDTTGDGWPDIVMIEVSFVFGRTNRLAVVPSTGSGTFGPPVFTTVDEGLSLFDQPVIADFDSDGRADVAVLPASGCHCIRVHSGQPDGKLLPMAEIAAGTYPLFGLRVGDFNSDARADLLMMRNTGGPKRVEVALGHGNGTFSSPIVTQVPPNCEQPSIGDLDGDGRLDVIFSQQVFAGDPKVRVYRGLGSGAFQFATLIELPVAWPTTGSNSTDAALCDFDRDGVLDIMAGIRSVEPGDEIEGIWFARGLGGIVFDTPILVVGPDAIGLLGAGDVDSDGQQDLLVQNEWSVPDIFFGDGPASVDDGEELPLDAPALDLAGGRIDGDRHADLAVVLKDVSPAVAILMGDGRGGFAPGPTVSAPAGVQRAWLADVSGDGRLDLLLALAAPGGLDVLEGLGDGSFVPLASIGAGIVADLVAIDFDGDGESDLVTCDPVQHTVSLFLGTGAGLFAPPQSFFSGGESQAVAVGDLDESGDLDLAVANPDQHAVQVHWDAFVPGRSDSFIWTVAPQRPRDVGMSDLDADGHLDLFECGWDAAPGYSTSAVKLLPGLGDGSFGAQQLFLPGGKARRLEVADVNLDGVSDLLVAPESPDGFDAKHSLGLVFGQATSPWSGSVLVLHTGLGPIATVADDFDGDRFPDLAIAQSGENAIKVVHNRSPAWATLGYTTPNPDLPPLLTGTGTPIANAQVSLQASGPRTALPGLLVVGLSSVFSGFGGGVLVPAPDGLVPWRPERPLDGRWPKGIPAGTPVYMQAIFPTAGSGELVATNALVVIAQ